MNMVWKQDLAPHPQDDHAVPTAHLTQLLLDKKIESMGLKPGNSSYYHVYDYPKTQKLDWLLKRTLDVLGATFGILILSPLFALIALAILLDSKGSVLYTQERVGHQGKLFQMYKFRSMYTDAEERLKDLLDQNETSVMFKIKQDPRITRVGAFLRKYSLDEFPQLINVLKGEMSLVGPRPPLLRELAHYEQWHFSRLSTVPGMTGLWQVFGRSNISNFDDVVCLDIHYLENWSFLNDLILILRTVPAVISAKGSY